MTTVATLPRSASPRLRLPRSPARGRLDDAVTELRRAVAAVDAEDRVRAAQREHARQENAAQTERRVLMAQARLATEIDRRWFWSTMGEMLDMLRACAADAKKRSEHGDARMIERVVDEVRTALEKIQAKEASKP